MNKAPSSETHSVAKKSADIRIIVFWCICAFLIVGFWTQLISLVNVALRNDSYSHILLVPFISIFLFYLDRLLPFPKVSGSPLWGLALLVAGAGLYWFGLRLPVSPTALLSQAILSFVLLVYAGFLFCFGVAAFRKSGFALSFLLLMVPIPAPALDKIIYFLQVGSAFTTFHLFHLCSVPALRNQFMLILPRFAIEIAKECSSIRSSMALFVTGLLMAHLYLRKPWTRVILVALTVPLAVFKNGVRIVTLSILAIRVDPRFMTGAPHHDGGFVFFLIALGILVIILRGLQSAEKKVLRKSGQASVVTPRGKASNTYRKQPVI